jgi:hypothetical protein
LHVGAPDCNHPGPARVHMGMTRRRALLIIVSFVALAVGPPVFVLAAAGVGPEPTHWSGTRLADVESPLSWTRVEAAPEPANVLLSRASDADQTDRGDLAPSWWDDDAGEVVLGAVTEQGEQARRLLAQGHTVPYRIERRAHSVRELTGVMDAATELSRYGVVWTVIDAEHNRVNVAGPRLSHGLFAAASRFGDTVAIVHAPFSAPAYLDEPPPDPPSWWSRADPPGTWFALTTGFPSYLGAVVTVVAAAWVVPWLLRRRSTRSRSAQLR